MTTVEAEGGLPPPTRSRVIPRRRFFSDMPDKGLFAVVAVAGFGAILFLKTRGFDADAITLLSAGLMIGYGIVAFNIPEVNMRLDRLGDNFYYLGFIFTLASLSAAILQVRGGTSVDQLIESFGIALVTTILGIAGRVVFVQMRSDLDEVEETARRDLSHAAAELRGEMFAAIREFQTVRTALIQTMQESSAAFAKASKANAGKLDEFMQNAAKRLDQAFEPGREGMRQVSDHMKTVSQSVELVTERIGALEIPSQKLNAQVECFTSNLEGQLRKLSTTMEDVGRRAALPNEQLNAAINDFTISLEKSLGRLSRTVDSTRSGRRWYWPFAKRHGGNQ